VKCHATESTYSKDKGTLSAAQNLTINANESITNGAESVSLVSLLAVILKFCLALITDELLNNLSDTLMQIATNFQDNHAVTEAIAKNGQFKINKPTKLQPKCLCL
jgi:hypothetical protein